MTKAENLKDIEYYSHTELCISLLQKWSKKSKNPELKTFTDSFLQVLFYATRLQQDRTINDSIIDEFRTDKIRAVLRARKSEEQNQKLLKEIKKLKNLTNL